MVRDFVGCGSSWRVICEEREGCFGGFRGRGSWFLEDFGQVREDL